MELEFLQWLRGHLPDPTSPDRPWTDDAAVVEVGGPSGASLVVTTDLISDGVDFRLSDTDPRRIGRKALAINLSDIAAMAARPLCATVTIALPQNIDDAARDRRDVASPLELAKALYEGLMPHAAEMEVPLVGGDTNLHDGPLTISVTALGTVADKGPLLRSGGQPRDRLLVTGQLGGSITGHHLDFVPRVREAIRLHERFDLHAGMDISDGLALDTSRLASASDCGAILDLHRIPISSAARQMDNPVQHALADGEDFELLLAVPPAVAEHMLANRPVACGLTDIGELTAESGLRQREGDGTIKPLPATGYLHGSQ